MIDRTVHQFYARANGYFWLPCPSCGEFFGGHEWEDIDGHNSSIPSPRYAGDLTSGTGICPQCTVDGVGDRAWGEAYAAQGLTLDGRGWV